MVAELIDVCFSDSWHKNIVNVADHNKVGRALKKAAALIANVANEKP